MAEANPLVALAVSTAISMTLIPIMWRFAPRLGLVDKPTPRKVHAVAIPRTGGLGIAVGTLLPIAFLLELDPLVQSYILGALVLVAFGIWDDCTPENGIEDQFLHGTPLTRSCLTRE
ncbi:MAG: hypothetical protein ACREV3_08560 [Gammaproteobacteria bacterium]